MGPWRLAGASVGEWRRSLTRQVSSVFQDASNGDLWPRLSCKPPGRSGGVERYPTKNRSVSNLALWLETGRSPCASWKWAIGNAGMSSCLTVGRCRVGGKGQSDKVFVLADAAVWIRQLLVRSRPEQGHRTPTEVSAPTGAVQRRSAGHAATPADLARPSKRFQSSCVGLFGTTRELHATRRDLISTSGERSATTREAVGT